MIKILIGGDICPTESNMDLFENGNIEELVGEELATKLRNSDYTILNLEVPLTDVKKPITKAGPNLIATTKSINGLKKINPYFYGLANNHILDQDVQGLESTIYELQKNGIAFSGVGDNLDKATEGYITTIKGKRIGIYCCAEHEFTIATADAPGANPFDPLFSLDHISSLKNNVDYLIVLFHGGKEYYRYPSPWLQKACRRMVDKGADLVICQHSHCVGCEEKWKEGTIVYGQGNFLFDRGNDEYWNSSLLIELEINDDSTCVGYIPIKKVDRAIRVDDTEDTINGFIERTNEIKEKGFVANRYKQFAEEYGNPTVYSLLYGNRIHNRILNRLSGRKLQNTYIGDLDIVLLNYMECEAHREVLIESMKRRLK